MSHKIQGCGYVALSSGDLKLEDVRPNTYPINASPSGQDKLDENVTDGVYFEAMAVGIPKSYVFDIKRRSDYSKIGNIADIIISQPRPEEPVQVEVLPTLPSSGGYVGNGGGSGGYPTRFITVAGGSSTSIPVIQEDPPLCETYDCACVPCTYSIVLKLNQQLFGPVSGASVKLYKATQEDDPNREILYEGESSISNEIDRAGIINLPVPHPSQSVLNTEEQNLMDAIEGYEGDFILEMSGGVDIDSDDNFVVDSSFTQVNGKAHLILTKERLLQNDYRVNILTEIAYQLSKDLLGENYDKTRLQERLDDIAKRVLLEKLYPDATQPLGRDDLFYWVPMAHKNWLVKPYDTTLAPIVNKVYAGESIYDEAYNYVYNPLPQVLATVPVLKSHWFKVDENATGATEVGSVKLTSEGNSTVTGYTLSGSGSELFRIESDGKVYLEDNASLDYEKVKIYQMQLRATNDAGESKPVTLYITINNILDVPEDRSFSGGVVAEDAVEGDVVGVLSFTSGATAIERIELGGTDASSFTVDINGTIRVSGTANFDYETRNGANITLQAFNSLGGSRVVPIRIAISDAVDVPIVKMLDVHLDENASIGTVVGRVNILTNDPLTSVRLLGSGAEKFSIGNNGTVRVAGALDYETRANYVLQVEAVNIQGTGRLGTLVVRLNNIADVAQLNRTVLHVLENSPVGTGVGYISVGNTGASAITSYTLTGTGSQYFNIDNTGAITLADTNLSHSTQEYFNLYVTANNAEGESLRARVVIYIDTQRPILGILDTWVYENSPVGTLIGTVPVASAGTGIASFRLSGSGSENFSIDANGTLRVAGALDYETTSGYTLQVFANNAAGESDSQNLYLRVVDRSDTIKLQGFSTTVYENASKGSTVGFIGVLATGGKTIDHYQLTGENAADFNLTSSGTLRISNTATLSRNTKPKYHLGVVAVDSDGVESTPVFVDITVADSINIPPVLQALSTTVAEDRTVGSTLALANIVSKTAVVEQTWLVGVGNEAFELKKDGSLVLKQALDYETKTSYSLGMYARNALGSSEVASLNIEVSNVIDDEPVLTPTDLNVPENTALGTVEVQSIGSSEIREMNLTGTGSENFSIDANGTLRVAGALDYESVQSYSLYVVASNAKASSVSVALNISVTNIPENPPTLKPLTLNIEENATIGTVLGKVEEDVGGDSPIVSYTLDDNSTFSIDANGTLSLVAPLDYETQTQYTLQVTASNTAGSSEAVTVTVNILNIIDDEPVLNDANFTVLENSTIGTTVGKIDINSTGTSAITSMRLEGIGAENFSVDANGTVRVAGEVDYEAKKVYHLRAIATNDKVESPEADVNVEVLNVAEIAPVVNVFHASVLESADIGYEVGNVTLINNGDTQNMGYVLSGTNDFSIDVNGTIRVNNALDYETKSSYLLEVTAYNGAGESTPVDVNITIINIVDGEPVIDVFEGTIEENASIGIVVGKIDVISEGNVPIESYVLTGDDGRFAVDVMTSQLVVKNILDFEDKQSYNFTIEAVNAIGKSQRVNAFVTVLDRPDTVPVVRNKTLWVPDNSEVGDLIGIVPIDSRGSRMLTVQLMGDGNSSFTIENDGSVYLDNILNYSLKTRYSFDVIATNTVGESNLSTLVVQVLESMVGTDDNETLSGNSNNNALFGNDGNDTLYGNTGADTLNGGAGDDILVSDGETSRISNTPYDDILEGGTGDDTLYGGAGNDTYIFNRGDGHDTIYDYDAYYSNKTGYNAGNDTLQFGVGITVNDLILISDGNNLRVGLREEGKEWDELSDTITIINWYLTNNKIENFVFEDDETAGFSAVVYYGTSGDDVMVGVGHADTMSGQGGNDNIKGNGGDDTLSGNDGNDTLYGNTGADTLNGGAGDDILVSDGETSSRVNTPYNDILEGGTGDDTLYGGAGNDTYIFNRGDGHDIIYDYDAYYSNKTGYNAGNDTLQFGVGIVPSELIIIGSGNNLLIGIKEEGVEFEFLSDRIDITNWDIVNNRIETFKFDSNVTWDVDTIMLNSQ